MACRVVKARHRLIADTELLCQSSVGSESVIAVVEPGYADRQHFFKPGRNGPGAENGPEVSDHRHQDLGTVRHGPEHVGNVSALLEESREQFADSGFDIATGQASDSTHG